MERRLRVQRNRASRREISRTTVQRLSAGSPLSDGHAVAARPHSDRAPESHPPAGANRAAVGRAAWVDAPLRAAAGRAGAPLEPARRPARRAGALRATRRRLAAGAGARAVRDGGGRAGRGATADAPRGRGGPGVVAAERHRAVQLDGAPSSEIRRGVHAGGRGDARDRGGLGCLAARPCAHRDPPRDARDRDRLRRAPALRADGSGGVRGARSARCGRLRRARARTVDLAAAARRLRPHVRAGEHADRGSGDPSERRPDGDQRRGQRRRLRRRAAQPGAEPRELVSARPPGRGAIRARRRVRHADRLADRPGRPAGARAHDLQRAGLHEHRRAAAADRRGAGALRLPEHLLQRPRLAAERRLLGACQVGARVWHRRLPCGRPQPGQGPLAAARCQAVSGLGGQASLRALADGARAAGNLALDTDFMGEGRYRTLLCLVQLAIPEGSAQAGPIELVDPLQDGLDCSPLAAVLADPAIQVVVHAGRQDVALVRRWLATDVRNVFDTQVAGGFVGLGAQSSYESLLSELLGVRLRKTASFTRWDSRPLSPEQLGYAREDVVHLLELAAELEQRLTALGRRRWAQEECQPLERSSDERDPEAIFARLPRVGGLNVPGRAVARELVDWREETAARQDRPVQGVLSDAALMELAKRRPSSSGELERIRGLGAGASGRRAGELLAVVRRAAERAEQPPPPDHRPPPPRPDDAPLVALAEALLRARAREAGLAYELLATRADLHALIAARRAEGTEADVRVLRGWRRELVGNELLELLDGRLSLTVRGQRLWIAAI